VQSWFFVLPTKIVRIRGIVIHRWKGLENTFPTVYYMPKDLSIICHKTKNKNLYVFNDCRSGWSKELQWENDYISFSHSFQLVLVNNYDKGQPFNPNAGCHMVFAFLSMSI
jgi:hypothetical protein